MPDTTVRVEYIGAVQNFSEVTITGNQQVWRIGSSAFVETGRASQLVASGKFRSLANDPAMLPANQAKVGAIPSGSGNVIEVGGVGVRRLMRPPAVTWVGQGKAAVSATANVTRHIATILPFRFSAVTCKAFNAHGVATPTMKFAIATADNISDPLLNNETWATFQWGGIGSVTPPVASNSTPGNQTMGESPQSDVLVIDPKTYENGTVLGLRSHADIASNTWFDFDAAAGAVAGDLARTGWYMGFKPAVDGIATPGAFAAPTRTSPTQPACLLTFYTADYVKSVALFGSSTTGGAGDTTDLGWPTRASRLLTAAGPCAFHFSNFSHGGATSSGNFARFLALIDDLNADAAVMNVFTVNDSDRSTDAGRHRLTYQIDRFIEECRRRSIYPVLQTWQHPTGSTGAEYANAKAMNVIARQRAAAGWCGLFDVAALFSDEGAAVGTWKNPEKTMDGIHPNSIGAVALTALAVQVFGQI